MPLRLIRQRDGNQGVTPLGQAIITSREMRRVRGCDVVLLRDDDVQPPRIA